MTMGKRLIAAVLALSVVVVMLFSFCFIIEEAEHDCDGDDCQICYQISVCKNALKPLAIGFVAFVLAIYLYLFIFEQIVVACESQSYNSLVSLKVKLSD